MNDKQEFIDGIFKVPDEDNENGWTNKYNGFVELAGELGWFANVGFTVMDCPTLVGPSWAHSDVDVFMPIGEEDESLFGDLGDLPESSVVLRRCQVETPCCGGTG
ncbi:putative WRKY transcription factor 69 [Forsythia ovata]|uniref:WRKY transcription factor 69 n=1 Tax=Forsythia ovata TaxID=205694 RepID=A0ABD1SAJ2_9LAMI